MRKFLATSVLPLIALAASLIAGATPFVAGSPTPIVAQSIFDGGDFFSQKQTTKIELFCDSESVTAGSEFCLFVKLTMEPGWHVYWKNPGEVGDVLRIDWGELPAGVSMGEWTWSAPKLYEQSGLKNFVLENVAFVRIPVRVAADVAAGELNFVGNAKWLACNDDTCVPQSGGIVAKVKVAPGIVVAANSEMVAEALATFPQQSTEISARATTMSAGESEQIALEISGIVAGSKPLRFFPDNAKISPVVAAREPHNNDAGTTVFDMESSEKISVVAGVLETENGNFEISATVSEAATTNPTSTTNPATTSNPASTTNPKLEWLEWSPQLQEEILSQGKILYIDFTARWCATCQVNKRVYSDENLQRRFAEAGVVAMRADWTRPNPEIAAELRKYNRAAVPFNVFKKNGQPDFVLPSAFAGAGTVVDALDAVLRGAGNAGENASDADSTPWLALVGLAFLGGLILNLMPCVFPVLGLKIMHFVSKAGSDKRKIAAHGFVFAFGVLVSFWILSGVLIALRSGGEQLGWGFQMQSPTFVFAMILLLFVFGLSMSGVFEFGTSATGAGGNLADKSGFAGSFFSGVLAVVVATPCAAPFLAPALGSALSLPPLPSVGIFTCIALGLAFPYVLLSCLPWLLKFLPKPGAWMESFKQAMAFLLYAPAAYFVWVLLGQVEDPFAQRDLILSLAVIALACWIYGRWCVVWRSRKARIISGIVALALFVATCAYDLTLF
ncbi:MAG: thioredoxin family protein [Opitutae bacterium]|nr:thioredoxin family protein [Opitutae bacterium]